MTSLTNPEFWRAYAALPPEARDAARKAYRVWKENPHHGSLRFQKRGRYWRVCFGSGHRALAVAVPYVYIRRSTDPCVSDHRDVTWNLIVHGASEKHPK